MRKIITILIAVLSTQFSATVSALEDCPTNVNEVWTDCVSAYTFADGERYVGEWKDGKRVINNQPSTKNQTSKSSNNSPEDIIRLSCKCTSYDCRNNRKSVAIDKKRNIFQFDDTDYKLITTKDEYKVKANYVKIDLDRITLELSHRITFLKYISNSYSCEKVEGI